MCDGSPCCATRGGCSPSRWRRSAHDALVAAMTGAAVGSDPGRAASRAARLRAGRVAAGGAVARRCVRRRRPLGAGRGDRRHHRLGQQRQGRRWPRPWAGCAGPTPARSVGGSRSTAAAMPRRAGGVARSALPRPGRIGLRAAGPAPRRARAAAVGRGERHAADRRPARAASARSSRAGVTAAARSMIARYDIQTSGPVRAGQQPVRRQRAEGGARPGAVDRAAGAGAHQPDRGRRRALEGVVAGRRTRPRPTAAPPCSWSPTSSTTCATATGCW